MKKHLKYLIATAIVAGSISQSIAQSSEFLDVNNVKPRINANHYLFNDQAWSLPAYEFPINSGRNSIFSFNLMLLGQDVNGQLKGAVPQINNSTDRLPCVLFLFVQSTQ